jgi:hypothetical protein
MSSINFAACSCKAYGWMYKMNIGKPLVSARVSTAFSMAEHVKDRTNQNEDESPVRVRILLESDYKKLTKAACMSRKKASKND